MWLFGKNKELEETVRQERGKLAAAVVKNDRVRSRLTQRAKETGVGDMLEELFRQLDEARHRD